QIARQRSPAEALAVQPAAHLTAAVRRHHPGQDLRQAMAAAGEYRMHEGLVLPLLRARHQRMVAPADGQQPAVDARAWRARGRRNALDEGELEPEPPL